MVILYPVYVRGIKNGETLIFNLNNFYHILNIRTRVYLFNLQMILSDQTAISLLGYRLGPKVQSSSKRKLHHVTMT